MKKPQGWDETDTKKTEPPKKKSVPAGKYVCAITAAESAKSKAGNNMLVLTLDIAEGPRKGFYKGTDLKYYQLTDGNSLKYCKALIETIEQSNPGFAWDWKPKKLEEVIGKLLGMKFEEKEQNLSGKTWTEARPAWPIPLEEARGEGGGGEDGLFGGGEGDSDDDLPFA